MAATKDNPVVFYDLVGKNGISFSLNTYKTRLSLDYKGIPYRVEYLSLPDIEPKMKELGVPPSSDNHPRYTIPMIADPSSETNGIPTYISDSFKIAIYLDDKYPAPKYPAIFAPYFPTIGVSIGPIFAPLLPRLLDDRSTEYLNRTRGDRTKPLPDDVAAQKWEQVREKFAAFSKSLQLNDGTKDEGPFIMGNIVSFLDFAVGGMVHWIKSLEGEDSARLNDVLEWEGGRWARHWEAMKAIENKSSRVDG
ncbi:glutathione S-transferase [Rhizoctonia solani]|uniref:Glutathione S-transferase n=1 Tax=Rhizoctonia solani TaxID=456999 RepID=A0A8H8SZS1_9AGAM|nr:glutathione S-transferase [Rhizoctonia solani]QRW22902.1 glutathione S-transferase [Rhizoctonia solani]